MRLIDADALLVELNAYEKKNRALHTWLNTICADVCMVLRLSIVKKAPTIEAEPVVRCKNCRYAKPAAADGFVVCAVMECRECLSRNDYCSFGEGDSFE